MRLAAKMTPVNQSRPSVALATFGRRLGVGFALRRLDSYDVMGRWVADEPDTDRYDKLIEKYPQLRYEEPEHGWLRSLVRGLFHLAGVALFLFALFMFWVALHHFFGIWPAPCNIPGTAC
jgi:hypothetical protein